MVSTLAFALGGPEVIVFCLLILVLFGSRLPSVMRSLGQSVTSFKSGLNDDDDAIDAIDEKKNEKKKK